MPSGNPNIGARMINVGGRCNEERGEANKFTRTVFSPDVSTLSQESTTYRNEAEAVRVVSLMKDVMKRNRPDDPFAPKSIGVVTPCTGQVQLIKILIANDTEAAIPNVLLLSVATPFQILLLFWFLVREDPIDLCPFVGRVMDGWIYGGPIDGQKMELR
jgi:hypothetical protein